MTVNPPADTGIPLDRRLRSRREFNVGPCPAHDVSGFVPIDRRAQRNCCFGYRVRINAGGSPTEEVTRPFRENARENRRLAPTDSTPSHPCSAAAAATRRVPPGPSIRTHQYPSPTRR
jgi:hypothetical protein